MDSITQKDVIRIMEIVEKANTDEFQLEMGDLKLTIRKGVAAQTAFTAPTTEAEPVAATPPSNELESPEEAVSTDTLSGDTEGMIEIKAPMLGTFYKAPKPGAPAFVEVGQVVDKDDTVCIVEVMKLFSTIKAGVKGRIVKVLANDGQMVEFGQPLFLLEAVTREET